MRENWSKFRIAYHHVLIFTNAGIEKPCLTQSDAFFWVKDWKGAAKLVRWLNGGPLAFRSPGFRLESIQRSHEVEHSFKNAIDEWKIQLYYMYKYYC